MECFSQRTRAMLGHPPMAVRNRVCTSGHESRWHVHKSLDMNMYKHMRKCIQWASHPWSMTWYIYVLVEFIVHDLWDMPVLAELRLTTYVRVVGTKGKHVSDTWNWDAGMGGLWKVGMDNLTMHTHSAHDMFLYLPFSWLFNYVLNSVLLSFPFVNILLNMYCKY